MELNKIGLQAAAEFIGCFILGVFVQSSQRSGSFILTVLPFACWATYMIFWRISNSHFNPAVTLVQILRKDYELSPVEGVLYMVAQFCGFLLSNFAVWWFHRGLSQLKIWRFSGDEQYVEASIMEFVGSLIFVLVHTLQLGKTTAVSYNWGVNSLVVGGFYGALIWWSDTVTGGSFNPAYGFARNIIDSIETDASHPLEQFWIYLVLPFVSALGSWALYTFIYKKAYEDDENKQVAIERTNEAY